MLNNLLQALMPPRKMIEMVTLKMESPQSIMKVAEKVETACQTYGFVLLQTYNYHEIVESKGFPIKNKVFIYDICQAKTASMMLASHPGFSIFMPCTISVYEDNGKTVISTMNMELMLASVKSDKALYKQAFDLFNAFKAMMSHLAAVTN